jgi:hypothetical protein
LAAEQATTEQVAADGADAAPAGES